MQADFMPVVTSVVTWALTGLLGAVAGWAYKGLADAKAERMRDRAAEEARIEALCDGMRTLLRCELVRAHREFVRDGAEMHLSDFEYCQRVHESYHALGGNGTGSQLWSALQKCYENGGNQ